MVGLGLKLEDLLKQKGLEKKVTNSFEKLVDEVTVLPQNSANASAVKCLCQSSTRDRNLFSIFAVNNFFNELNTLSRKKI